jgi:hypothetical protein
MTEAGHLVQPVADAAQAEAAQPRRVALGEVAIAQEAEGQRRMRAVQELEGAGRLGGIHLVEAELVLEDVERPIRLLARRSAEMRGTVDEDAGPVDPSRMRLSRSR